MRLTARERALAHLANSPLDMATPDVPEKRARYKRPEAELQEACVQWLRIRRKRGDVRFIAHNPERKRTYWKQNRDKAMGLDAGATDLILMIAGTMPPRTVFVELKSAHGKLTAVQEEFRDWVVRNGWAHYVVRDIYELQLIVGA